MRKLLLTPLIWSLVWAFVCASPSFGIAKGRASIRTRVVASSAEPEALVYVNYRKGALQHQFWIRESAPSQMSVSFQENKKRLIKKSVPEADAKLLVRVFNDLYQQNSLQPPVTPTKCTPYATLKILGETTQQICQENAKATGEFYDLLTKLRALSK